MSNTLCVVSSNENTLCLCLTRGRDRVGHVKSSKTWRCDFYSEDDLSEISSCSETHLQLPLKINIFGKKLCEV